MTDYKRLTRKSWHDTKFAQLNPREVLYKLWQLENQIENGTNLIGEKVIGIHKCTDGTYYPDLFDENIVIGFTSNGVVTWNNSHGFNDYFENGYYFPDTGKGRAEAETRLEELTGGGK